MRTRKRILGLLAVFTPLAVFCSLQFGPPRDSGVITSVLQPLLPATAHAADCNHSVCYEDWPFHWTCTSNQWTNCVTNPSGSNCWYSGC